MTTFRAGLLWGPVAIYMAAIFVASSSSNPPAPAAISDKVLHIVAYAGLALFVLRALAGGLPARLSRALVLQTLLITVGYGVTDEVHQMFVPLRSAEWYDLAADAAGAVLALIACWAWSIIEIPEPKPQVPHHKKRR